MNGKEVHRWQRPFSEVWPHAPHIARPLPDSRVYWDEAHVFPNGDILATFARSTTYLIGVKDPRGHSIEWAKGFGRKGGRWLL